jgi:hypothetical protein
LTIFTSMKTTKATIRKLMIAMMKLPSAKTGAPASCAAERGIGLSVERIEPAREIDTAREDRDDRIDQIAHKRRDDRRESRADDDAHGHVHDIAARDEVPELVDHFCPPVISASHVVPADTHTLTCHEKTQTAASTMRSRAPR